MKDDNALTDLANNTRTYGNVSVALKGQDIADMADELVKLRQVNRAMRKRVGNLRSAVRGLQKAYEYVMRESQVKRLRKDNKELHQALVREIQA